MIKVVDLRISPENTADQNYIKLQICKALKISIDEINHIELIKRSLDARKPHIVYQLRYEVYINEPFIEPEAFFQPQAVHEADCIYIVGAGPAGLFAALSAIENGRKPIVYERGKSVRERRRDLARLNKDHIVNPESNYCFGEGGAGTYSDGKLYTRSKKRGDVRKVLQWLVHFGADKNILVDAHPHIGTNRLPKIIEAIREGILAAGGEVHFNTKMTDILVENNGLKGIELNNDRIIPVENLILATGHSARDIFYLLHKRGITIEAKSFALGVRVEHPQYLIDEIQYHGRLNDQYLPPAAYSLVSQAKGVGVFSFCMCPGGIVAPCATEQNEVVTNGWSPSKRNNPYANSGIVVQIEPEMLPGYTPDNPLICLEFQKKVEYDCWSSAGKTQAVPAQRLIDFLEHRVSDNLPESSYIPGLKSVDLNTVLPQFVTSRLQEAFLSFEKKMNGFLTNSAILHAPESRTSSPVRIPRDKITLEHIVVKGLYPCAEGAGYAGGIVSAAVDGIRCVDSIVNN